MDRFYQYEIKKRRLANEVIGAILMDLFFNCFKEAGGLKNFSDDYLLRMEGEYLIETKINKNYIWSYFISLFVLWCVRELWFARYLDLMNPISAAIIAAIIKISIWVIPVFVLVEMVEKENPLSYFGLRDNLGEGLKWAAWTILALVTYIVANLVVLKNDINLNIELDDWLNGILLVGITEELVFRGFILRKFMSNLKFWKANTITSALFVLIHFPIWFYKGLFETPYIMIAIAQVFILGVIFGFIYRKTNSLWSVIIIHSMYNLCVTLLN